MNKTKNGINGMSVEDLKIMDEIIDAKLQDAEIPGFQAEMCIRDRVVGAAAATMAVASMGATYLAEGARQMAAASSTAADAAKSINTSGGTPFATPNPDGSAQTVSHDPWEVPDDHLTRKPK